MAGLAPCYQSLTALSMFARLCLIRASRAEAEDRLGRIPVIGSAGGATLKLHSMVAELKARRGIRLAGAGRG
jgi:hypothetical protein